MWTSILPVVFGSLGLTGKFSDRFTLEIPGSPWFNEIQVIVLINRNYTLRKDLFL